MKDSGSTKITNKKDFVKWILDEITMSGQLDESILPEKEIERIIDNETETLYDIYQLSLEEAYTIIPRWIFYTPQFRKTRTIHFPDCIKFADDVYELKGRSQMWGINDPDISFARAFQADLWMSPMGGDTVTFRTIQWQMWDQMKNFIVIDMRHSWNEITHNLLILGHDPQADVFIHLWQKLKGENLWNDPWARKWIAAKCKKQVAKMLGLFSYNLIGGVTINANFFSEEADKDLNDCNEYFKNLNHPGFFVTTP